MSIYTEFATGQDIVDYVQLNLPSLAAATDPDLTLLAMRVIDHATLVHVMNAMLESGILVGQERAVQFAIMIASEAIERYEIAAGICKSTVGD